MLSLRPAGAAYLREGQRRVTARLTAKIEVSALIRRVGGLGGNAAVLARGDADAGAILLFMADRGAPYGFFERTFQATGDYRWSRVGPNIENLQVVNNYIERRRAVDGDLWVIELDIPGVERFAAEMTAAG